MLQHRDKFSAGERREVIYDNGVWDMASFLMILNDLQGHFTSTITVADGDNIGYRINGQLCVEFSTKFSFDVECHAVPLRRLSLLFAGPVTVCQW